MYQDMENSGSFWRGHLFSLWPGSLFVKELPVSFTYTAKYLIKEKEEHEERGNPTGKNKDQEMLPSPQ